MTRKIDDIRLLEMAKEKVPQKEMAKVFKVSEPAVSKRLRKLIPPPNLSHLTDKQAAFALAVAQGNTPTEAAFRAFDCKDRVSAKVMGCNMMKKPDINAGITELMDYHGLTRSYRVGKLRQHVDHVDPNVSLKALDQTWKLEGAYLEKHMNYNLDFSDICRELEEVNRQIRELKGTTEPEYEILNGSEALTSLGEEAQPVQEDSSDNAPYHS